MFHYHRFAHNQRGFALLFVLIFLQLLCVMSLYSLAAISESFKGAEGLWERKQSVARAEYILTDLETKLPTLKHCQIPPIATILLVKKPMDWWIQWTCSGNLPGIRYYYAVEFLGKEACTVTQYSTHQAVTTDFYRMTLLALPDQPQGSKIILQSTSARLSDVASLCSRQLRFVHIGRLTKHEL